MNTSPAGELVVTARRFYARGWLPGTAGNLSCVVQADPLLLAVTASSVHKGELAPGQIVIVDANGRLVEDSAWRPSAEVLLHVEIARRMGAGAIFHTHSVWNTLASDIYASEGAAVIEGYELLKALEGNTTHETREVVPILDNDQNMPRLAARLGEVLGQNPGVHGILLRRHGLYTWGRTPAVAERHVEVLEFLFETIVRTARG